MNDAERDAEIAKLMDRLEAHEILIMVLGCKFPLADGYGPISKDQLFDKLLSRKGIRPGVITATESLIKKLKETVQ